MNLTSNDQLTYFAHDWIDKDKLIGLAQPDRRYHFYTLGRSGMGKSTMLFSKIVQDLQAGRGHYSTKDEAVKMFMENFREGKPSSCSLEKFS